MTDRTIATRARMRKALPLAPTRFLDKLKPMPSGCWEWTAAHNGLGYGRFRVLPENRLYYAHRLAYQWHRGIALSKEVIIRHQCDNPPCCNPAHLLPGTQQDNVDDAIARGLWEGRSNPQRGEKCYNAILTEADVIAIRQDRRVLREIADQYGISIPTAHAVKSRRLWKHVR